MTAKLKVLHFADRTLPVLNPVREPTARWRTLPNPMGWDAAEVWRTRIKPARNERSPRS